VTAERVPGWSGNNRSEFAGSATEDADGCADTPVEDEAYSNEQTEQRGQHGEAPSGYPEEKSGGTDGGREGLNFRDGGGALLDT
jgi:hypothetical protein